MRFIIVHCCFECPYRHYDNGAGFIEPFKICEKFNIILSEYNREYNFNEKIEIHKDCELKKQRKSIYAS